MQRIYTGSDEETTKRCDSDGSYGDSSYGDSNATVVIPAQAGIHLLHYGHTGEGQYPVIQVGEKDWTPAFAGVTEFARRQLTAGLRTDLPYEARERD